MFCLCLSLFQQRHHRVDFFPRRPSGAGKSTRLAKAARDYQKRGVPVFYIRFRGPGPGSDSEGDIDMSVMARRLFTSIGYSSSPSVVHYLLGLASSVEFSAGGVKVQFNKIAASRLTAAFEDMVAVAVELDKERKDILDDDLRKPIIIVDEVHQLLRNAKYGKAVLNAYTTALIDNVTDMKHFRSVSANSGGDFPDSEGKSNRVREEFQKEVPEPAVRDKLRRLGYPPADEDLIVAVCGDRLRLLEPFLGPTILNSDEVKKETKNRVNQAASNIDLLKKRDPTGQHVEHMRSLLDKVAKGEVVKDSSIPAVFNTPFPMRVLYLGPQHQVFFQSSAVRYAWAIERQAWTGTQATTTTPSTNK